MALSTTTMHLAFQECIRRLYVLPTRLTMKAVHEHTEMQQVATRLSAASGTTVKLPSYDQVRREVHRLERSPELVAVRERAKSIPRVRESPQSFALSIPSPVLLNLVECPECGRMRSLSHTKAWRNVYAFAFKSAGLTSLVNQRNFLSGSLSGHS